MSRLHAIYCHLAEMKSTIKERFKYLKPREVEQIEEKLDNIHTEILNIVYDR